MDRKMPLLNGHQVDGAYYLDYNPITLSSLTNYQHQRKDCSADEKNRIPHPKDLKP